MAGRLADLGAPTFSAARHGRVHDSVGRHRNRLRTADTSAARAAGTRRAVGHAAHVAVSAAVGPVRVGRAAHGRRRSLGTGGAQRHDGRRPALARGTPWRGAVDADALREPDRLVARQAAGRPDDRVRRSAARRCCGRIRPSASCCSASAPHRTRHCWWAASSSASVRSARIPAASPRDAGSSLPRSGPRARPMAPIYYLSRLGRLSPLTSYAAASWPSLTSLLFPLADVNMGVLVRYPPVAIVVMVALLQRRGWREPAALPAALTGVALLLVISQQPNMNQGGNPDLSRYIVWLLPLALPWLLALDRSRTAIHTPGRRTRRLPSPRYGPRSHSCPRDPKAIAIRRRSRRGCGRGTRHGRCRASRRSASAHRIASRRSFRQPRRAARRCCCSRGGGRRTVRPRRLRHRHVTRQAPTAMPIA